VSDIPWLDETFSEDDLLVKDHEEICEDCRLVKVRCLDECGSCFGPSVHEKGSK